MSALLSLIGYIIISISLLCTEVVIYADATSVKNGTDLRKSPQAEKYEDRGKPLQEENDNGESIPPSFYELYPDSDEFDLFDEEEEASYCS